MLVIIAETGNLPEAGGLMDQEAHIIDDLGWFVPVYDMMKWGTRVSMFMGDGKAAGKTQPAPQRRRR
jgi:hypothetical protein